VSLGACDVDKGHDSHGLEGVLRRSIRVHPRGIEFPDDHTNRHTGQRRQIVGQLIKGIEVRDAKAALFGGS